MKVTVLFSWPPTAWRNRLSGVYKISFGSEIYIGSSLHLRRRISQWESYLTGKATSRISPTIRDAIQKNEHATIEILELITEAGMVRAKEEEYIDKYKSTGILINQSFGASDNFGYKRMEGDLSPIPRPIVQIDLRGNIIAIYRSTMNASKVTGIRAAHITKVLKGNRFSYRGFIFSYCDEKGIPINPIRLERNKGGRPPKKRQ